MPQQYKRRKYYIDKEFQNDFIFKFCGLVVGASVITVAGLYLLSQQSTTVAFVGTRVVVQTTADFIFPVLVQTVAVVTLITAAAMAVIMTLISHRIAGPLYRFSQRLKSLADGNVTDLIHLRKKDQLTEVADEFNKSVIQLKMHIEAIRKSVGELDEKVSLASDEEDSVKKHKEFREKIAEIEDQLDFFKTF